MIRIDHNFFPAGALMNGSVASAIEGAAHMAIWDYADIERAGEPKSAAKGTR